MIERRLAGGLSLSALALVGLLGYEGFTEQAIIPVQNDVPTVGFGSTVIQGKKVELGDTIDPVRAVIAAHNHINTEEQIFRQSIAGVALYQHEYDAYMDFVYQFGTGTWTKSSMRANLLEGDYAKACGALLLYRFAGDYDCSTLVNGKPNARCYGVWMRQLERNKRCNGG